MKTTFKSSKQVVKFYVSEDKILFNYIVLNCFNSNVSVYNAQCTCIYHVLKFTWGQNTLNTWIHTCNDFFVFNATFSNISAISWRPVLVVEEAGVPGENHRPWASNNTYMYIVHNCSNCKSVQYNVHVYLPCI
jgi:hypothetical protein